MISDYYCPVVDSLPNGGGLARGLANRPLRCFAVIALLLAVATASHALSAAASSRVASAAAMPTKFYIQGDSLTYDSMDSLRKYSSPSSVWVSAKSGRHTYEGLRIIQTVAAKHQLPGAVVVALGTNDDVDSWGVRMFRSQAAEILRLIGPSRCVVWIDLYQRPKKGQRGAPYYAPLNRVLESLKATHHNLRIHHWSRIAALHPSWFAYGDPHPSSDGYETRSRGTVNALRGCPRASLAAEPKLADSGGVAPR